MDDVTPGNDGDDSVVHPNSEARLHVVPYPCHNESGKSLNRELYRALSMSADQHFLLNLQVTGGSKIDFPS